MKDWGQQRGVPSWGGDATGQDAGVGVEAWLTPRATATWGSVVPPPVPRGAAWGQRVEKPTSAELKLRRGDPRAPTGVQPAAR